MVTRQRGRNDGRTHWRCHPCYQRDWSLADFHARKDWEQVRLVPPSLHANRKPKEQTTAEIVRVKRGELLAIAPFMISRA